MSNAKEDIKKTSETLTNLFNQWKDAKKIKEKTHKTLTSVYRRSQISTEMSLSSPSFRIYDKTQEGFVQVYIKYGEVYGDYDATISTSGEWSHHIRLDTVTCVAAWRIAREYIQMKE